MRHKGRTKRRAPNTRDHLKTGGFLGGVFWGCFGCVCCEVGHLECMLMVFSSVWGLAEFWGFAGLHGVFWWCFRGVSWVFRVFRAVFGRFGGVLWCSWALHWRVPGWLRFFWVLWGVLGTGGGLWGGFAEPLKNLPCSPTRTLPIPEEQLWIMHIKVFFSGNRKYFSSAASFLILHQRRSDRKAVLSLD